MPTLILVQEDEFLLEINIGNMQHDPRGVFVIYEWDWLTKVSSDMEVLTRDSLFDCSYSSALSHQSSPRPLNVITVTPDITHVIVFKCTYWCHSGRETTRSSGKGLLCQREWGNCFGENGA